MRPHFRVRWGIDQDLYNLAVHKNIDYLHTIIEDHDDDYRELLKRGGIVEKLEKTEGVG
jgi:hypothetical protein